MQREERNILPVVGVTCSICSGGVVAPTSDTPGRGRTTFLQLTSRKKGRNMEIKKKKALRVDCTAGQVEAGGARGRGDRSRGWPVGGLLRSLGNCGGGHSRLDLINRIVWELLGS